MRTPLLLSSLTYISFFYFMLFPFSLTSCYQKKEETRKQEEIMMMMIEERKENEGEREKG